MSELHKFLFDGLPVRGMLVRLTDAWREVLARREPGQQFPPELRQLLGEMSAAAVLMQSNIKFNGALVLQIMGDGPVKLAVAEAQHDLSFRATAKCVGEVAAGANLEAMLNVSGQGRCVITLDPKDKFPGQQSYQGVVPLHDDQRQPLHKLSEVLEHYMLQSEQLDTKLVLAANDEMAAGLLIQRLPLQGEVNLAGRNLAQDEDQIGRNEDYNRIALLAARAAIVAHENLRAFLLAHAAAAVPHLQQPATILQLVNPVVTGLLPSVCHRYLRERLPAAADSWCASSSA